MPRLAHCLAIRARRPRPSEKIAFRVIWGLRTPAMTPLASPRHVPARPPARRLSLGHHDIPRACVRPVLTGAETAPLRENRFSRHLRAFHRKAISPWMALPAEGRAPHARKDGIGLAGACPHLATRYSFAPDDLVMPRLASGLTTRTRRPRPSEKTAFGAISGLSPIRPSCLALSPWRGGLCTPARMTRV
jgi:hypothetical protein